MYLARMLAPLTPIVEAVRGGTERWPIKTGTDPDALGVPLTAVPSTIEELAALAPPLFPQARTPLEKVVYAVPCVITLWKIEADGDHHLVLMSESGATMIGEIPDPSLIRGQSAWASEIADSFHAFHTAPLVNQRVTVTGVGFFDRLHGQTGVARNGIELHPVFSIA